MFIKEYSFVHVRANLELEQFTFMEMFRDIIFRHILVHLRFYIMNLYDTRCTYCIIYDCEFLFISNYHLGLSYY